MYDTVVSGVLILFALYFLLYTPVKPIEDKPIEYFYDFDCERPTVKEGNYYVSNNNDPNFGSNVLDFRKFYTHYPSTYKKKQGRKSQKFNSYSHANVQWNYHDELPMNGGILFDNVSGYDMNQDAYSTFQDFTSSTNCQPEIRGTKRNDDLRMGMGTLNQEIHEIE